MTHLKPVKHSPRYCVAVVGTVLAHASAGALLGVLGRAKKALHTMYYYFFGRQPQFYEGYLPKILNFAPNLTAIRLKGDHERPRQGQNYVRARPKVGACGEHSCGGVLHP